MKSMRTDKKSKRASEYIKIDPAGGGALHNGMLS